MKSKTYHVFHAPEGTGETYIGPASTLKEARHMAAEHARGSLAGLGQWEYETARKAGHIGGYSAPPPTQEEAVCWFGRGGWYCACLEEEKG